MRKSTFIAALFLGSVFFTACKDNAKDREINVEEEMVEIHENQSLTEQERADHFIGIPVYEPMELVNDEISDGGDKFLLTRTYIASGVKLLDVFEFYKNELPKSNWRIDTQRTQTEPYYALYATDGKKNLNIGIDGEDGKEIKFFLTLLVSKE